MDENLPIPDFNVMGNMIELGNNVLKLQENYNLIFEKNNSLEKEMKKCMDKEVDNDKNLSNIQDSFDQKIKLFQKEITNKLEQKYKENCSSLELKIQKIEEENTEKITTLEQMISDLEKIIHQKDEKINSLDCEIKQKISEIELDHYRHLKDIQDKYDQKTEQIQNEIKQIKTENEANIKAIKQKNKEKYQQLETENKNRIENLAEILNEKEVKITALDGNITRTNQLIQTLETRINRNENAHLNDIEMLSHNILQKGEKINSMEIQNRTAEEINNEINKKLDKIINEQKNLINPKYMQIENKWKYIDNRHKCCEDNCVNTNTPTGKCKNGNGFIEIINDTDIKYNECIEGKGENKKVWLNAENKFYKPKNDFTTLSYYYEIKIKKEGMNDYSSFGFRNTKIYIVLGNNGFINYSPAPNTKPISFKIPSFSWNDGDIFGFGLVFPPTKILEKHPYVFFTQNGNEIGKAVLLKEGNAHYFNLHLNLKYHHIETNFGNDLDAKPFCFDVSKNLFAEEFYN